MRYVDVKPLLGELIALRSYVIGFGERASEKGLNPLQVIHEPPENE
jgi:hypothetical protein